MSAVLDGKVAIVTGAAGDLGRAFAGALANAGAAVLAADLDAARVSEVAEALRADGLRVAHSVVDITDEASVQAMAQLAAEEFGGVDILVNNAALMLQIPVKPLIEFPVDWWDRVMKVNVAGALICTQACAPSMIERGGGRIVNMSSAGAFYNWGPYGVSKLAVVGLTYGLSRELGPHKITVNAIAPGSMRTEGVLEAVGGDDSPYWESRAELTATNRVGEPEDLCAALLYLVSPEAEWVSGQCLNVDGGWINRL